jgi:DNA polymerase-3 subunit epsilon
VQDAELIIHNAPFDLGFLDMEFQRGLPPFREHAGNVIDTLREARQMFPGKRNSLDALCDRLGVSNATARCTAHCSMPNCWPRSTWP